MYEADFESDFQEKQSHNKFKFKCVKGCNLCCSMNDIALYPFDIMLLCNHLNLTTKEFHLRCTRFEFDSEARVLRCYLTTTPECVFFDNADACKVYDSRPVRCRLFPVGRIFNRDGSIQYYLPRERCQGFESGHKFSIHDWIDKSGVKEKDELIREWNHFINELKNNKSLPLTDEFFIMFFKKIFYDFDNDLHNIVKLETQPSKENINNRMKQSYELAKLFLFHIDKWKKGYNEIAKDIE